MSPTSPGNGKESNWLRTGLLQVQSAGKDDWLKWSPMISRGPAQKRAGSAGKADGKEHHGVARFFHHEKKSEDDIAGEQHPKDDEKHGFFHKMFH